MSRIGGGDEGRDGEERRQAAGRVSLAVVVVAVVSRHAAGRARGVVEAKATQGGQKEVSWRKGMPVTAELAVTAAMVLVLAKVLGKLLKYSGVEDLEAASSSGDGGGGSGGSGSGSGG